MTLTQIKAWLKQPTTVAGLMGIVGTLTALVTGQVNVATAIPVIVGSIVGLVLPDNSAASAQAKQTATDTLALVQTVATAVSAKPVVTPVEVPSTSTKK